MILKLFAEQQPLDGVVVGEEGHHVLQEEAFAKGQQLGRVVHLCVDVVGHDVADVNLKRIFFQSIKPFLRKKEITKCLVEILFTK